jgi:hypothetical protein
VRGQLQAQLQEKSEKSGSGRQVLRCCATRSYAVTSEQLCHFEVLDEKGFVEGRSLAGGAVSCRGTTSVRRGKHARHIDSIRIGPVFDEQRCELQEIVLRCSVQSSPAKPEPA